MTKHKHYYAIRAYADGWKIEYLASSNNKWYPSEYPEFAKNLAYRVVPDEDGWLPWYGGECPVDGTAFVNVRYKRCLVNEADYAHLICWEHLDEAGDVIAYRDLTVKPVEADPYAELKAAAKDPTKQIRCGGAWADAGTLWTWNRPVWKYEIRNKPTKMKLRAWVYLKSGNLTWKKEGHSLPSEWKRVPSEDKEVEVEE